MRKAVRSTGGGVDATQVVPGRNLRCVGLLVGTVLVTVTSASAVCPVAASPLGTPKKATGAVVTLGFVSDGKSDAIDNTSEIKAAEAAVSYARATISVGSWLTQARVQRVRDAPDTVRRDRLRYEHGAGQGADRDHTRLGSVGNDLSGHQGLRNRLPAVRIARPGRARWFARERLRPHERHRHRARRSGGDRRGCGGQEGRDPGDRRARRVLGLVKQAAPIFYKNADVTADVIVIPVGQADMTPQIQAGISGGDGVFAMVGNPAFCTSAIKGLTTVGFKGPVTVIQQCVDQTSAKATNGGYKGVNVLTTLNSANKEYLQYLAVMKKYA